MAIAAATPLDLALARLEKRWGVGVVMNLDEAPARHPAISTGHPGVDQALGIGGFAVGKFVELYGFESSGKTTLALHTAAHVQHHPVNTGRVLYLDYENSFDKYYAERLGVLTDKAHLKVSQPDFAEQGMDVLNEFIEFELCDMVIVDSVAAMLPESEVVDDEKAHQRARMGHTVIGSQSRVMSQSLKQLATKVNKKKVLVLFINQIRTKIGTGGQRTTQTTTGGNALKFYASQRVEVRKVKMLVEKGSPSAMITRVKVAKNKVAPPFRECDVVVRFGTGMDVTGSIVQVLIQQKLLAKGRTGFYDLSAFGYSQSPRGDGGLREFLEANPEAVQKFTEKVDWEAAAKATAKGAAEELDGLDPGLEATAEGGADTSLGGESNPDVDALLGGDAPAAPA